VIVAISLEFVLHLKPCMYSFVASGSRWISLAERTRSSFALVVLFCVQVRMFFLLSAMPTRAVSRRSRQMRAGFPTRTSRRRSSEEAYSLLG
jgi:hypothetical protein